MGVELLSCNQTKQQYVLLHYLDEFDGTLEQEKVIDIALRIVCNALSLTKCMNGLI